MTDVTALATAAARHWGGLAKPPRLIRNRENAVLEIHLSSGEHAALRLHRAGYQTQSSIRSELIWTETLAEAGFPCPRPIRTQDGNLTALLADDQSVSVVSWIDADPIGESGVPFEGTLDQQLQLYTDLGALTRRLHETTDRIDTSAVVRPSWNAEALLGDTPHWGRFWTNPALTSSEHDLLQQARENAAQQLNEIKGLEMGLIHADLIQENVLTNANGLHIIDFDDSGTGYRLYDLGAALIQHAENRDLPDLTQAICAGYGCKTDLMPLFIMLRAMASCGWIIARAAADDPRQRFYAERALNCAQRYMSFHV